MQWTEQHDKEVDKEILASAAFHKKEGRPNWFTTGAMVIKVRQILIRLINQDFAKHMEMIETLSQKIQLLEQSMEQVQKSGIRYRGVYQRADVYDKGHVVTHKGSAWVSLINENEQAPGDFDGWQLMVKAGRDARQ